jgi:hypothetical protein
MTRNEYPIANPSERDYHMEYGKLYLFQFGAYGTAYVYAWGNDGLDDALEEAAAWLKEHGPGLFHEPDYADAANDIEAPEGWADDEEWACKVQERAETDLTYTESGYLASWEWYVNEVTDADEVEHVRWRSLEGADEDEYDADPTDDTDCEMDPGATIGHPWRGDLPNGNPFKNLAADCGSEE